MKIKINSARETENPKMAVPPNTTAAAGEARVGLLQVEILQEKQKNAKKKIQTKKHTHTQMNK